MSPEVAVANAGVVTRAPFSQWLKKVTVWGGGAAMTAGLAFALWPHVGVTALDSREEGHPFTAPFRIKNQSFFIPLTDLRAICYVRRVSGSVEDTQSGSALNKVTVPRLGGRGASTVPCSFLRSNVQPRGATADLVIVVDYQMLGFWSARERVRFTGGDFAGKWLWLEQPMSRDIELEVDAEFNERRITQEKRKEHREKLKMGGAQPP